MQNKLRFISIVYVILLSVGLFAHVEIIPFILNTAKRDSWVSILLTVIILPLWIYVLYKIVSILNKRSIISLLKDHGSVFSYSILLLPLALYMLVDAFVAAKEIIYWSQLSYMQGFNSFTLALILLIFCLFCTEAGLFSLGLLSSILCPIVLFLGFFISFANMKKKHYELLFPLFTDGFLPVTKGLLYTSLPILELFIIIFLTPVLQKAVTRKQLFIVGVIIIGLMLGPTVGAIVEFSPATAAQYRYPAYEQWRIISIGRYFSHTDFFAIFQWLSGGVIRISLFVFISSRILTKGLETVKIVRIIYAFLFIACVYPVDQSPFATIIYGYFRPFSFFLLIIQISMITIYIVKNKQKWFGGGIKS
ncbi:GerAB/ArcD/ProY family transporter [Paenibacillus sp. BSR1-1]|uniref:GerAB/ArcD/ProY family transporter n=1 Tax=Paenibacillus sp. BSR1-1 TaxID=3020845 RepID=UPI0025B15447|nr:GerAB/ArcD/ProY family transporter [Paenibacillus sp. BSR1-1]MDN3020061.1 GerAB/ArcD/ProY family transporter [Paenibacillus sp. BSR1-1]